MFYLHGLIYQGNFLEKVRSICLKICKIQKGFGQLTFVNNNLKNTKTQSKFYREVSTQKNYHELEKGRGLQ